MPYAFEADRINGNINADDGYWQALEEGEFRLPRCEGCEAWTWPAHHRCGRCGSWEFDWTALGAQGVVYSWTRCWYVFDRTAERAEDLPYVVVVAAIPEADGARVIGVLRGSEEGLRIGAPVTGRVEPPADKSKGYPSLTWALDPVADSETTPTEGGAT